MLPSNRPPFFGKLEQNVLSVQTILILDNVEEFSLSLPLSPNLSPSLFIVSQEEREKQSLSIHVVFKNFSMNSTFLYLQVSISIPKFSKPIL